MLDFFGNLLLAKIVNFVVIVTIPIICIAWYYFARKHHKKVDAMQNRFASMLQQLDEKNKRLAEENGKLKEAVKQNTETIAHIKKTVKDEHGIDV